MVADASVNVGYALGNATDATSLIKCEKIHDIYSEVVNDAACGYGIKGIFVLGVLQAIGAFPLLPMCGVLASWSLQQRQQRRGGVKVNEDRSLLNPLLYQV